MVDNPFSPEVKAYNKRKEELELLSREQLYDIILEKEGHKKPQCWYSDNELEHFSEMYSWVGKEKNKEKK